MTPDQYNYEFERERRANMKPYEIIPMLGPVLGEMVRRWAEEDADTTTHSAKEEGA